MASTDPLQAIPKNLSCADAVRIAGDLGIPVEQKTKHIVFKFSSAAGGNFSVSYGKRDAGQILVKKLRRVMAAKQAIEKKAAAERKKREEAEEFQRLLAEEEKRTSLAPPALVTALAVTEDDDDEDEEIEKNVLPAEPPRRQEQVFREWAPASSVPPFTIYRHSSGYYTYARDPNLPQHGLAPTFGSIEAASVAAERAAPPRTVGKRPSHQQVNVPRHLTAPMPRIPRPINPSDLETPRSSRMGTTLPNYQRKAAPSKFASQENASIRVIEGRERVIAAPTLVKDRVKANRRRYSISPDEVAVDFSGRITMGLLAYETLGSPSHVTLVGDAESLDSDNVYRVTLLQGKNNDKKRMGFGKVSIQTIGTMTPWTQIAHRVAWAGFFNEKVMSPGERVVFKASAERVGGETYIVLDLDNSRREDTPRRKPGVTYEYGSAG